MPPSESVKQAESLADFEFVREGLRQDQRERHGFLAFALAACGTILGLLVRPASTPSSDQALVLLLIAASITIVAEVLTIRATLGVASAGVYLRMFVESPDSGLKFQTRNRRFLRHMDSRISASWGFAVAYLMLTGALAFAWFTIPLHSPRGVFRSGAVIAIVLISTGLTAALSWSSRRGWKKVEKAWGLAKAEEEAGLPV
jgi:hypothetical protein